MRLYVKAIRKSLPSGRDFYDRALRGGGLRSLRRALFFDYFWLIPGSDTGNQEEVSPVATGDSGLCPENPQTFEKVCSKL